LVVNEFHRLNADYKLYVEIGYPDGLMTLSQMMDRLNIIEQTVGKSVHYYITPEGCKWVYNGTASDGTLTRDNIKSLVKYIQNTLNKTCFWIPVEAAGGKLEVFSFYWIFLAQDYIGFDIVTPQPHYLQVKDLDGDPIRPIGMKYSDLVAFMKMSHKLGYGVEFESNSGIVGNPSSDCECSSPDACMRRAANYWCALQSSGLGPEIPISYYFDITIGYEQAVVNYLSNNPCPPSGFPTC